MVETKDSNDEIMNVAPEPPPSPPPRSPSPPSTPPPLDLEQHSLEMAASAGADAALVGDEKPPKGKLQSLIHNWKQAAAKNSCAMGECVPKLLCRDDSESFQPLKNSHSQETGGTGRTLLDDDDDEEEATSSSSSKKSRQKSLSQRGLTGIEVEIESSSSSTEDCLHRKRHLENVWLVYKKQIILAGIILFVFLFGVMIGACGTGQCRKKDSNSNIGGMKWQENPSGTESNGQEEQEAVNGTPFSSKVPKPTSSTFAGTAITNSSPTLLGPNVFVFDPSMTTAEIQSKADSIFRQQQNNEMGEERYALLFQPGTYGSVTEPLMIQIGYYTELIGLGKSPLDVRVIGKIEVYNRCFEADPYADGKFVPTDNSEQGLCFALNSFWRGLSNLSIQIVSLNQDDCRATANFWAVSQATSMRRVHIEGGDLSLMDYCSNPAYASGGFIADTMASGKIISGSQQQFLTRNSKVGQWDGAAWNSVLVGVTGAPADDSTFPDPPITVFATNPMSREKPYVFVNEAGEYHVHVPILATDTSDVSWASGETAGRTIPISSFHVASPSDSVASINEQLASGKHLLFTPGVYNIDESIVVDREDTVVLGIGIASLTAVNGAVPLKVSSQPGIIIAGVTIDAGLTLSPVLLQVGELGDSLQISGDPSNPITLSDVYFRVGGPHIGKANVCLEINSNNVLIDHTWVWRADHGVEDFDTSDGFEGDNERWRTNIGLNGVVVNGNDVTATGLFVEHYQEYNLVWNGERGRVYFFQNELPYEPPSQEDWMADDGTVGWAAYKVNDSVMEHELYNGGVYCYNRNNPDVVTTNGFETPTRDGVKLSRIYTRNLSGPGTILNVVNGIGQTVNDADKGPYYVLQYPQ